VAQAAVSESGSPIALSTKRHRKKGIFDRIEEKMTAGASSSSGEVESSS